jgi:predicted MFS family arabinose efflux permease
MTAADRGSSPYAVALRRPHALPLSAWAALARLQFGIIPISTLLLLSGVRGSYAEAGAATAAYGLTAGLLMPVRARAADRFGHGRVLVVAGALNAVGVAAIVALASAPLWALVAVALVAGSLPPPVGPVMRSSWHDIVDGEASLLRTAFSFDSVSEEVLYVVGPLVAAATVAAFGAPTVILVSVGLLLVATVGMASVLRTMRAAREDDEVRERPAVPWRSVRFVLGLLPALAIGVLLGGLELAAVAVVVSLSGEGIAGVPAALIAIGSIAGGLVYGRRRWRGSASSQAVIAVLASAAAVALSALVAGRLLAVLLAFLVAGAFVAPAIVASYLVADDAVEGASAESTAWVTAAFNVGTAGGTLLAGLLVDRDGPGWALAALAATTTVLTLVAVAALRRSGGTGRPAAP